MSLEEFPETERRPTIDDLRVHAGQIAIQGYDKRGQQYEKLLQQDIDEDNTNELEDRN